MRILIYGAGAVGCYIGGHLALAGQEVTLLGREPLVKAVQANGLILQTGSGSRRSIHTIKAQSTLAAALDAGPFDWIAFTMKAYGTVPAIHDLLDHLTDPPPLVSFQNGIGNEESLQAAFGQERVTAATLTTPVSMAAPGVVVEERQRGAAIAAAPLSGEPARLALAQTGLLVQVAQSGTALKWSKLLLNVVGNATAAILDMLPAEVFASPTLFRIEQAALREVLWVMDRQGIPVIDLPGAPARLLAGSVRRLPGPLLRSLLRGRVGSGRGAKLPSLLAALRAGQRYTEVAWLNGAVARAADDLGFAAPVNHALALILSDIAAGRDRWETYRRKPDMLLTAIRAAAGPRDHDRWK